MTEQAGCVSRVYGGVCVYLCACTHCLVRVCARRRSDHYDWAVSLFFFLNDPAHSKLHRALFHHCACESDCGITNRSGWIRAGPFVSSVCTVSLSCICRCVVAKQSANLWNKTAENCISELFSRKINVSHSTPVAPDSLYLTCFYCEFGAEKPLLLLLPSTIHMISIS